MMSIRTPASSNSKIREKKINISEYNKNLISDALSLIWVKTDHKVDTCSFEKNVVKVSYKQDEGYEYFDLHESLEEINLLSSDFKTEFKDTKIKLSSVLNELEDYKNKYKLLLNQNIGLRSELQKVTSLQNHSIYDPTTAGSDGIIDELTKEVLASVDVKDYCNDIDKWIVKNEDTLGKDDATIIGKDDTTVSSDIKSSASVIDYRDDIDKRIMKNNNFDKSSSEAVTISSSSSSSSSSASSIALTKGEEEAPVRKISNGIISKCKQTNNDNKNDDIEKSNKSKGQKRKINCIEISSNEDDKDDNKLFDPLQLLLLKKGRKLKKILLHPSVNYDDTLIISNRSGSKIINVLNELSAEPIKIIDENSAEARIYQWQKQELQYEKFRVSLESYNLLHLMSLIQIYEDLLKIGEEMKNDPEKNIKNVKTWVIEFIRNKLKIKSKMEQRNRLACNRLLKLFNEGITSEQLVKAGFHKCDFFVKQENYDIILSQIPSSLSSETSNINLNNHLLYNNEEFDNNTKESNFIQQINNNNQNSVENVKNTSNKKQKIIHVEENS
ncbi:hypothetical protein RclHR1_05500011 [Rhizophagus clarus]|uniref:Uncharacterized protein n=1 Tax=Rhizophagus clarus TaxID=94130 RepID=A0A2Z6RMS7_9GLOM|nr:hypothetical protein RclHR1_05500011 [Rhizophagus clarus]GES80873.1 hypothetical protein GLOIN_2v1808912 [Rhizophagus clarus]